MHRIVNLNWEPFLALLPNRKDINRLVRVPASQEKPSIFILFHFHFLTFLTSDYSIDCTDINFHRKFISINFENLVC